MTRGRHNLFGLVAGQPAKVPCSAGTPLERCGRADAYASALSAEHPGMHYTRTDALRIILAKPLPPLSPDAGEPAKPDPTSKPRKSKQRP